VDKVLIANRGEIAVRLIRGCHDTGLSCVAVYADQELDAPHVRLADEAFALGGTRPADTYLAIGTLVAVALRAGADAVHPGYGFLAENADFAQAVVDAGLTWIGPPAKAIRDLGDKTVARRIAAAVGAPLVPGLPQPAGEVSEIRSFADEHGYPLLIKAAFGGGGRGMKVVRGPEELDRAYESAVRESTAAFGRGECFVERYLDQARHLETQCLADRTGKVVVLSTRDCSLQRRNQKLVEEAPAPFLTDEQVHRLYDASKAILAEAGYVNAGTCEFLLAPDGTISFNEVNTRLQVEHPVTELVTGCDVVVEQLRIASGGLIDYDDPVVTGHAIEFRVNGEDPANGFLPSPGRLERWRVPSGPGVRWDGAYEEGDTLPAEFDSLLGKLIVYGRDRRQALARARRALSEFEVEGVATVLPMDRLVAEHPDFVSEPFRVHTHWIETVLADDLDALPASEEGSEESEPPGAGAGRRHLTLEVDGRRVEVTVPGDLGGLGPRGGPALPPPPPRHRREQAGAGAGTSSDTVASPMQARVVKLVAGDGQHVTKGETVVEVEAMKMEQSLCAPADGWVRGLSAKVGDEVQRGEVLCRVVDAPPDGRVP
jgi:acetyl-CoA/propionyl-CoA carboxylase biotin carboxyl carrier protein